MTCVHCGVELVSTPTGTGETYWGHVTHLTRCQSADVPYGHRAHPADEPCPSREDGPNPCLGSAEQPCTHTASGLSQGHGT